MPYFILPILVHISNLFGPEGTVKISTDKDLKGVNVKANVHLDFTIKFNNKRVCIIHAKKYNMRQGTVDLMVGMEVVSDLNGLDTVYGIVTNYYQWIIVKSQNDKFERVFF